MVDNGSLGLDSALNLTGVKAVRDDAAFAGIDGSGIATVIIDTGIDLDHAFFGPDADHDGIADRIIYQYDFADGDLDASDLAGHGSHIGGIIGSQDAVYQGVAPATDLIVLKVFEDSGKGYFSYLEQALQWVILNQEAYDIGVVNLSLGDGGVWTDTFSRYGIGDELAALAETDVIVVGAAGNYYNNRLGLAYPASDPAVIAVGATWAADFGGPWRNSLGATNYTTGADQIAAFSQRDGDLLDVFAPGARFSSASANGGLSTSQGTSQAAAFVSGVAALAQQIANEELGRGLSTAEFALLLQETGDVIVDGDDENDNVLNTGLEYGRINFQTLARRLLALDEVPIGGGNGGSGGGSGGLLIPAAPGVHEVSLAAGEEVTDVDFGNFQLGGMQGTVYEDLDGDGNRQAGESGLSGWTIYLDINTNGAFDTGEVSALTDGAGAYAFADLGPGSYRVAEILPSGWLLTTPATGYHEVTMTSGLSAGERDFGNQLIGNRAPLAAADSASTKQTIAVVIDVLANDTDPDGDPLTVIGFTQPRHGQVNASGNGALTYTPHTGYSGLDSFTYTNSDNKGGAASAPVNITVTYAPPYTSRRRLPSPPPPPPPPPPLEAASAPAPTVAGETLTTAALDPIVAQALYLRGGSLTPADLEVTIADLPGARLGQASGQTITLDLNAAGHGWFIDPTPADNLEFSLAGNAEKLLAQDFSPAFGKIDLLTVVSHELGHVLGFDHDSQGVMAPTLATGERQTPLAPNQAHPHEKVVLLFDEDKGELAPPVLSSTQLQLRTVKFNPELWRNPAFSLDNGEDDWIMDFGPRKIRRSG